MMKRLSVFLMICLISSISSAAVILNDTFADGDRTDTALPNESGFWASSPADVTTTVGSVALDMAGSSRRMHTYFTPAGSPVSLGVGEKLIATIDFIPEVAFVSTGTSRNFRMGLFYNDAQYAADSVGDSGTGNGWTDATGYLTTFGLSDTGTVATARNGKRTNLTGGLSLLGTDGAYTYAAGGTGASFLSLDTVYTIKMILDYQAANSMQVSFEFSQGETLIASCSLSDDGTLGGQPIYTDFDFLMFRLSSSTATAEVVDFQSITIEHIVPEPATLALLGLGGLFAIRRKG
jgi:hypothetical protein